MYESDSDTDSMEESFSYSVSQSDNAISLEYNGSIVSTSDEVDSDNDVSLESISLEQHISIPPTTAPPTTLPASQKRRKAARLLAMVVIMFVLMGFGLFGMIWSVRQDATIGDAMLLFGMRLVSIFAIVVGVVGFFYTVCGYYRVGHKVE